MSQSSSTSEPDATARNEQSQHPEKPKQANTALIVKVAVILAVTVAIWFIPVPSGVEPRGMHMLAIFAGTILGLIFQPLPTPSVALIGLGALARETVAQKTIAVC